MRGRIALACLSIICITFNVRAEKTEGPRNAVFLIRNLTTGTEPLCSGVVIRGNFGLTVASCFPMRKYDRPYNASDLNITILEPYSDEEFDDALLFRGVGLLHGHSDFQQLGLSDHWMNNVVLLMLLAKDSYLGAVEPYIQKYGDYLKAESLTILNSERCHVLGVEESDEETIFYEPAIAVDDVCDQFCKENSDMCTENGYYVRLLVNQSARLLPGAAFLCPDKVVSVIDTGMTCGLDKYIGELTAPLAVYKMLHANLAIEDTAEGYVTVQIDNSTKDWDFEKFQFSSSHAISENIAVFSVYLTILRSVVANKMRV